MMAAIVVLLSLAAWAIVSVGAAVLWGAHCRQAGWREGFDDGFDSGASFANELQKGGA